MQTLVNLLKPVTCLEYVYDCICRHFSFMPSTTGNIASVPTGFYVYDASGVIGEPKETVTGALNSELVDLQEETAPFHALDTSSSAEQETSITAHITLKTHPGILYYGYRYYSPDLGRWMSRDPIGEWGGLHLYGFVFNNPIKRTDYLGQSFWDYIPVIGTIKAFFTTFPGQNISDYDSIKVTVKDCCPRDEFSFVKELECRVAINADANKYIGQIVKSGVAKFGIDAVAAALGLLAPPYGWIATGIGGLDAIAGAVASSRAGMKVYDAATQAKKQNCDCSVFLK